MPPLELKLHKSFKLLEKEVEKKSIPGGILGAVNSEGERYIYCCGDAVITPKKKAMTLSTWFDLASLTKVFFTTIEIINEANKGSFKLDDPLTKILPDLRQYNENCWERKVTFRQCLGHQTNFPAVEPLYTYGQDQTTLRAFILQRAWKKEQPKYSDINYIMLGLALERLKKRPISKINAGWGFSFLPNKETCAATEFCSWRGKIIEGMVHDENAFALGSAGHAGLFGTMTSALDFALDMLTKITLSNDTVKIIRTPLSKKRTHGWERPYKGWSGGDNCNGTVIGHTGFTGTGIWIDFERELAWCLFTNRVHPSRFNSNSINKIRRNIGNIMCEVS